MMTVRTSNDHTLTGWPAVGALAMILLTNVSTALVLAYPLVWLANKEFAAGGAIRAVFGTDQVNYWHCVGLFAIWQVARIKVKFSGPGQIKVEGNLENDRRREGPHRCRRRRP